MTKTEGSMLDYKMRLPQVNTDLLSFPNGINITDKMLCFMKAEQI